MMLAAGESCSASSPSLTASPSPLLKGELEGEEEKMQQGEPDADAIKMFVGQVPRSYDEHQLRSFFRHFGPVHQLNVLRDKATGASRGCCFVTFFRRRDAIRAQAELHDLRILPGMHHPLQMRPADGENRNDKKLFVGMLSKSLLEADVAALFAPFGPVDDCNVLRDERNQSRGCAFVTFASRQSALNAIKGLHHSQTLQGCTAPLVVKQADSQKEAKKTHATATSAPAPPVTQPNWNPLLNLLYPQNQVLPGLNFLNSGFLGSQPFVLPSFPPANPGLINLSAALQPNPAVLSLNQVQALLRPKCDLTNQLILSSLYSPLKTGTFSLPLISPSPSFTGLAPTDPQSKVVASQSDKQVEGPDGCNLFIYHLPQETNDGELVQLFAPFGTLLSAKVFVDKLTGLSKCFGFVSFDNPRSAQQAIGAMNGFRVGGKRLKVQLKRPKSDPRPY